jgi:hypothetical protein
MVLLFNLKVPSPNTPILTGLKAIDWSGSLLIVGGASMVLLALDFGNVTYPWSSAPIISLMVLGVLVMGIFIVNEWKFTSNPIVPLRLFSSMSSAATYAVFSLNFYVYIGLAYYLPLYSQSVLGVDALSSGVYLLPLIVSCSLSAAATGVFMQRTGTYLPVLHVAQLISTLGVGLFINLDFGSDRTKLFIFEVIAGIGAGMNIEPPMIAAQAAATVKDTASVVATMGFLRSLLTAISVVVGGVIFQNAMNSANPTLVNQLGLPLAAQFNGDQALVNVELIASLPSTQQDIVRRAYFDAIRSVWIMVRGRLPLPFRFWLLLTFHVALKYVVFSGVSTLLGFFVRAHHLSTETTTAVLGLDRDERTASTTAHDQILPDTPAIELSSVRHREARNTTTS